MNWFSALVLGMALGLVTGLVMGFTLRGIRVRPSPHLKKPLHRYGIRTSFIMKALRKALEEEAEEREEAPEGRARSTVA